MSSIEPNAIQRSSGKDDRYSVPASLAGARLAILTHYLPPYMARVLEHLVEHVPQTQVLISVPLEPNRDYKLDWGKLDVQVQKNLMVRLPWKHRIGFKDETYVHVPYDTYARLRKFRPDLVFSYELGFRSLGSALYRRMHPRSRLAYCVCVSEHTEAGRGNARWLLRKTLLRFADAVTYNGPSCQQYLRKLGVPDSRLFHFPYAADDRTAPDKTSLTESSTVRSYRLLYVGQLIERKGLVPLIETLNAYCNQRPERKVDLTVIGAGPVLQQLRETSTHQNLQVHLEGSAQPHELSERWCAYDALVFPTLADEWGLVVNEAMRAGLPVIGSCYAQASTTLIRDSVNGWQYSPDKPTDLHRVLDQFYSLPIDKFNEMRAAALETVKLRTSSAAAELACRMFESLTNHLPGK